jgi:hypothetical protein
VRQELEELQRKRDEEIERLRRIREREANELKNTRVLPGHRNKKFVSCDNQTKLLKALRLPEISTGSSFSKRASRVASLTVVFAERPSTERDGL